MKVLFLLPSFGISGGIYIVVKAAELLVQTAKFQVAIALPEWTSTPQASWLNVPPTVALRSYREAAAESFDIVIATWWETLFDAVQFEAATYALFMQAMENSFYTWGHPNQQAYEHLLGSNVFPSIATARWMLNYASQPAYYFLCGLDKTLFHTQEPVMRRRRDKVRFLIEGPITDPRKNVAYAIDFLEQNDLEYLWVGADASTAHVGKNCLAVFSGVSLREMAGIYSSADVLIKLSNSEGMFGPPLEMFSCGGTAICWDIWGCEEYMIHGYNSFLCPTNNFSSLARYVGRLRQEAGLLEKLKRHAKRTSEAWPSWPEVGPNLVACIHAISQVHNRRRFLKFIRQSQKQFREVRP